MWRAYVCVSLCMLWCECGWCSVLVQRLSLLPWDACSIPTSTKSFVRHGMKRTRFTVQNPWLTLKGGRWDGRCVGSCEYLWDWLQSQNTSWLYENASVALLCTVILSLVQQTTLVIRLPQMIVSLPGSRPTPPRQRSCPVWTSTHTAPTSSCCLRPSPLCVHPNTTSKSPLVTDTLQRTHTRGGLPGVCV